ncbi:MAG: carbohydrate kinase family protein [Burkholderiales bacterium]|nr:carbohydrate kinase family protein [Burkholderiales bacterium]
MNDLLIVGMAYFEVFVPPFPAPAAGEEVFIDGMQLALGGALNTASVAAALGMPVSLCLPMGGGLVDHAVEKLAHELGIQLLPISSRDNPAISLVFSDARDRSFVSTADLDALITLERLPTTDWIHVPGLEEAARLAIPLADARDKGAQVSVSGSWSPQQLSRLAAHRHPLWDLLILNEKEAQAACGDAQSAPQQLAGVARSVLVTRGSEGAFGVLDGYPLDVATPPVAVTDSTGAGDAFCAGLIAALQSGLPAEAAVQFACRSAARLLQQTGGLMTDARRMADLKEIVCKH